MNAVEFDFLRVGDKLWDIGLSTEAVIEEIHDGILELTYAPDGDHVTRHREQALIDIVATELVGEDTYDRMADAGYDPEEVRSPDERY
jgi:hypothetical protein